KLTSGTTAAPRAIRFRSEQLLADCDQICQTMGIFDTDLNFGVIPVSHSYGFSNLLTPLIARGVSMILSQDRTPRAVLDNLEATNEVEGFVGGPMKNVDLELIDPRAESSQIQVRSAAAGDGYFPEADERKLHGGVFVPDDLLVRQGDGFKIVGRISDVINVAGKKVNPAEIEEQLLCFRGVREAVA